MDLHRFRKPIAALLLALACAPLVVTRAATGDQGHTAAADAADGRALARRSLRGIETSIKTPAGGNVTTKGLGDVVDSLITGIANFWTYGTVNVVEYITGSCNHGNWCGEKCPKPNDDGTQPDPPTVDRLDEICKKHDACVGKGSNCQTCRCHADMLYDIEQFLAEEDCVLGGNWANDRCQSSLAVKEAPTIATGIGIAKDFMNACGNEPWEEGCPSSTSSTYQYTITMATSCDSGSGTNGAVRVRATDANGGWFETGELDNFFGNDREECSVDTYERDPVDYKVLLNSDTTCEVYFEPKGPNPIWKPDYVQIARASDSEETKAAKFCNDGRLEVEGWYTFYFCD